MPKLTDAEVDAFLDEDGHLARIGTIDADGFPRVLPLWFVRVERRVLFTPRSPAVIWANIQRDPRVGISVDEDRQPYRKVTIRGVVDVVYEPGRDDEWRDLYRTIARRYTPEWFADDYVDGTDDQPRALCAVELDAAAVSTWRMPVAGEDRRGVWAKRYYLPGTKWSSDQ